MGHRANYVLIRKGKVTAYEDHWGALSCTFALLDGPDNAADINAEETRELMEWAWAEGGYLIDFDRKIAIAFGVPDFDPDDSDWMPNDVVTALTAAQAAIEDGPRKYLDLVAPKWPGWTLTWDERGVDAFGAHLKRHGLASQLKLQPPHKDDFEDAITVIAAPAAKTAKANTKVSAKAKQGAAKAGEKAPANTKKRAATKASENAPANTKKRAAVKARKKAPAKAKNKR